MAFPKSTWQYLCLSSGEEEYVFLETLHYIRKDFKIRLALFKSSLVQIWALEQAMYLFVCILLYSAMKSGKREVRINWEVAKVK